MTAVAAMHEEVHERTQEQWQVNEHTKNVRPVFSEQERSTNQQEPDKYEPCWRGEKVSLWCIMMGRVISKGHNEALWFRRLRGRLIGGPSSVPAPSVPTSLRGPNVGREARSRFSFGPQRMCRQGE